jgi:hypothetical protein
LELVQPQALPCVLYRGAPVMIPAPDYGPPVTVTWTPTASACVVWCAACHAGSSIYTTALRLNPEAIVEAVEAHRGCMDRHPAGTLP